MCFHAFFTSRLCPNNCKVYLPLLSLSLRLFLATTLNLNLSAAVFQTSHIEYFEKFLCYTKECMKLKKMYELWPPHHHALLYFTYSIFIYCAVRYCVHALEDKERNELRAFRQKYWYSFVVSTLIFMLTLHVQRIIEFHFAVIVLNFVHTVLTGAIVTFVCI